MGLYLCEHCKRFFDEKEFEGSKVHKVLTINYNKVASIENIERLRKTLEILTKEANLTPSLTHCVQCGKEFDRKHKRRRTCSNACRTALSRKKL